MTDQDMTGAVATPVVEVEKEVVVGAVEETPVAPTAPVVEAPVEEVVATTDAPAAVEVAPEVAA